MKTIKLVVICLSILLVFYLGMFVERHLMPGKDPLKQAVFSKDGLPGFTDLYTLSGNRSGIAVCTHTGDVYYCRINLFGDLTEKEFLFSTNDYWAGGSSVRPPFDERAAE